MSVYNETNATQGEIEDALRFVIIYQNSGLRYFLRPPPATSIGRLTGFTDSNDPRANWLQDTAAQMLRLRRYYALKTDLGLDAAFQELCNADWKWDLL